MADVNRVSKENKRAAFAYEQINRIKGEKEEETQKKFRSLVRSLPLMIRTNGLGTTVTFLFSKKGDGRNK